MPKQMSREELESVVKETIDEVGAKGKSDFGKVMKALMPKLRDALMVRLLHKQFVIS